MRNLTLICLLVVLIGLPCIGLAEVSALSSAGATAGSASAYASSVAQTEGSSTSTNSSSSSSASANASSYTLDKSSDEGEIIYNDENQENSGITTTEKVALAAQESPPSSTTVTSSPISASCLDKVNNVKQDTLTVKQQNALIVKLFILQIGLIILLVVLTGIILFKKTGLNFNNSNQF